MPPKFALEAEVKTTGVKQGLEEGRQAVVGITRTIRDYRDESIRAADAGDKMGESNRRQGASAEAVLRIYRQQAEQLLAVAQAAHAGVAALTQLAEVQSVSHEVTQATSRAGVSPTSTDGQAISAAISLNRDLERQIQETTAAQARADVVAGNLSSLRERTAALRQEVEAMRQGEAEARTWAEAQQLRQSIAQTGALPGTSDAAAVEAELVAQQALKEELAAIAAARERDAAAALEEAAAQEKLTASLSALSIETKDVQELTAAQLLGSDAVALLNNQLEIRNALLSAGVASWSGDQFVVTNTEGAAAVQLQVRALQEERAVLAQVKEQQVALRETATRLREGTGEANLFSRALGEVLQALKFIVVYGALFALASNISEAVKATVQFEDSLTRLRTLVGLSAAEVESLRGAISGLSVATGQSADENAKALFAITSAGQRGEEALRTLKASAQAAAIGLGDQTTVARAAVAAMTAYGAANLSAVQATNVLIATARAGNTTVEDLAGSFGRVTAIAATVGVHFDELGAAVATFTRLGVSAQEAVTGLRGVLSALELKESKGANAALKTVGLSVVALRQEIKDKGLAEALIDLVKRFNGNNDELAKIIPNIRALSELLATARSQAGTYAEIQAQLNQAMKEGSIIGFDLIASNPAFVFKQLREEAAEAGRTIVTAFLPQLVAVAREIKEGIATGDIQAWAQRASIAFTALVAVLHVLAFALDNTTKLLAAWVVWSVAAGVATTALGHAFDALLIRVFNLGAAIAANPLGALAVALVALEAIAARYIEKSRRASQAYLDENARINEQAVAIARLRDEFLRLPSGKIGFELSHDAGTFLGQLDAINKRYKEAVEAAHGNAKAIGLADIARQRDIGTLQAHEQAVIDDTAALIHQREEMLATINLQIRSKENEMEAIQNRVGGVDAAFKDQDFTRIWGDVKQLVQVWNLYSQSIDEGKKRLDVLQKGLDQSRTTTDQNTKSLGKLTSGQNAANFELNKAVALRAIEAESAARLAQASRFGAAAQQEVNDQLAIEKALFAERERRIKAGLPVDDERLKKLAALIRLTQEGNEQARVNVSVYASEQQSLSALVVSYAALEDAKTGLTLASQQAQAIAEVDNEVEQLAIDLSSEAAIKLREEALARVALAQEVDRTRQASEADRSVRQTLATAEAALADAIHRSTAATREQQIQDRISAELKAANLTLADEAGRVLAATIRAQEDDITVTNRRTAAQVQLNAAIDAANAARADLGDDRERLAILVQFGQGVSDLVARLQGASQASRQLALDLAIQAEAEKEQLAAGEPGWDALVKRITDEQTELNNIADAKALLEATADVWRPVGEAWQGVLKIGVDALNQWVETGKLSAKEIAKSLLTFLLQTFEQILQNWIQLQISMAAVERARQTSSAVSSTVSSSGGSIASSAAGSAASRYGGGAVSGVAGAYLGTAAPTGYFSGVAAGLGGQVGPYASASAYSGALGGSAASSYAVVALWAAVIIAVVLVLANIATVNRSTKAQVDIGVKDGQFALGETRGVGERIVLLERDVAIPLINTLNQYIAGIGGTITSFNAAIELQRRGRSRSTDYRVTVTNEWGNQIVEHFGKDANAALAFSFYSAIANTSISGLDPIVTLAIHNAAQAAARSFYKGISKDEQDAIRAEYSRLTQEAQQVATIGQPQQVAQLKGLSAQVDATIGDMLRLLGPTKEFDQAVRNITTDMQQQLESQRDSITGRQRSAQEDYQSRLQAAILWNAELALRKANLVATRADLQAKILDAQVTINHAEILDKSARGVARTAEGLGEVMVASGNLSGEQLAAMKANLKAIDETIAALDAIKPIDPGEVIGGSPTEQTSATFKGISASVDNLVLKLVQAGKSSDDFAKSLSDVTTDMVSQLTSQRDAITGRQQTAAEELAIRQAQAEVWNAELALRKADIAQRIIDLEATLQHAKLTSIHAAVVVESGQVIGHTAVALAQVVTTTAQVTEQQLKGMEQSLEALKGIQAALDNIHPIDPSEIRINSSGGGGTSPAQQLQDLFDAFDRSQLPQLAQQILDVNKKWDDALKLAGKNADAIARVNEYRKTEIDLLEKQARDEAVKNANAFINFNVGDVTRQINGVHDSAQGLIDGLRQLHDAGALSTQQLHQLVPAIRAAEQAQINAIKHGILKSIDDFANSLSNQGLAGQLAAIADQGVKLQEALQELADAGQLSVDEFNAAAQKIRDGVRAQQQAAVDSESYALLGELYGYLHDDKAAAQLKYDLTVAELQVREKELEAAVAMYGLSGALIPEIQALIDKVIAAGPGLFQNGGGSGSFNYNDAVAQDKAAYFQSLGLPTPAEAQQQLQQYLDLGLSPMAKEIRTVNDEFAKLRAVLGNTAQVQQAYNLAIQDILDRYLQPIRDELKSLQTGELSPLKPLEREQILQGQFADLAAQIASGDLSHLDQVVPLAQQLLQSAQAALPTGSQAYQDLFGWVQNVLNSILTQYGGAGGAGGAGAGAGAGGGNGAGGAGGAGAGGGPGTPGGLDFTPVTTRLDAQLGVLNSIDRNGRATVDGLNSVRNRLDQPLGVYQRAS